MTIKQIMEQVKASLREAERLLIAVEKEEVSMDEKLNIATVLKPVREGIQKIKTFFPEAEFNELEWMKRHSSKDTEHDVRMQKILTDAVATGAYDDSESKPNIRCHFDYSDEGIKSNWKGE